MKMDRDSAAGKTKFSLSKRTDRLFRSPPVIKRAIGHGIAVRKKRGGIVINYRHTNFVQLRRDLGEPLVAKHVPSRGLVSAIDVSAAPQSSFFGGNRIDNHSPNGFSSRRVEPADQQQNGTLHFADCLEA